jgi:membrane protease YdiL (CAAX protease family)
MEAEAVAVEPTPPPATPPSSRRRWWFHLLLLGSYPLLIGVMSWRASGGRKGSLLPDNVAGLLYGVSLELAVFSLVFALALRASRATPAALLLTWRGGGRPIVLGLAYSVALRIVIAVVMLGVVILMMLAGGTPDGIIGSIRPKTEMLIDPRVLAHDPVYYGLMLTLVSFVMAGLREELWRSGMFAALAALFPGGFARWPGKLLGIGVVALIFGLGHLPQGLGGVGVTLVLGLGLGAIMLGHRSIWEAVLAHGCLDATSFVLLHWLATHHPGMLPGR